MRKIKIVLFIVLLMAFSILFTFCGEIAQLILEMKPVFVLTPKRPLSLFDMVLSSILKATI